MTKELRLQAYKLLLFAKQEELEEVGGIIHHRKQVEDGIEQLETEIANMESKPVIIGYVLQGAFRNE